MVAVESYNWSDFAALGPVVALVVGACVLLISEVFLTSRNRGYQVGVSVVFATIAGLLAFSNISVPARIVHRGHRLLLDRADVALRRLKPEGAGLRAR
jgi:hypothetical protein